MCNSTFCTHVPVASRRHFLRSSGALALALAASAGLGGVVASPAAQAAGSPKPGNVISPDEAIRRLIEGNQRYQSGTTQLHDFSHERKALVGGQNPYAAILGCADSRVVPEYAFDSSRGDIFVARVAGNFVNDDVLGSLEYAVGVLSVPAILVLGHDKCGAVEAAVKAVSHHAQYPGHIQSLVTALIPAVEQASSKHEDLLEAAIQQNVRNGVANLAAKSSIIHKAQQAGTLKIAGGIYRLDTGKVDFLG